MIEWTRCGCTAWKRCAFHKAEDDLAATFEELNITIKALRDRYTVGYTDVLLDSGTDFIELLLANYSSVRYWRLQAMHRRSEA